jgi:tRNA pseudouridine38-40 synthase
MQHFYYLIEIQYLGYRYHGWQTQPKHKTVQFMVDKTIAFVLQHNDFRTITCSRTDSKVSANHSAFELFLKEEITPSKFLADFNSSLPNDIRALSIKEVDASFNIIQNPKLKEYQYLFSFGEKPHPFAAALIMHFNEDLNIALMKKGAKLFEGRHNFVRYCTKPNPDTQFVREIIKSEITINTTLKANFFPKRSFIFHLHGRGFMRYQARLMMAQLIELGKGNVTLTEIKESLTGNNTAPLNKIAPSSGLMLNKVIFE